jgi:hypothetical protein
MQENVRRYLINANGVYETVMIEYCGDEVYHGGKLIIKIDDKPATKNTFNQQMEKKRTEPGDLIKLEISREKSNTYYDTKMIRIKTDTYLKSIDSYDVTGSKTDSVYCQDTNNQLYIITKINDIPDPTLEVFRNQMTNEDVEVAELILTKSNDDVSFTPFKLYSPSKSIQSERYSLKDIERDIDIVNRDIDSIYIDACDSFINQIKVCNDNLSTSGTANSDDSTETCMNKLFKCCVNENGHPENIYLSGEFKNWYKKQIHKQKRN